jgi:hypothetical protein
VSEEEEDGGERSARRERIARLIRENVKPREHPSHPMVQISGPGTARVFVAGRDIHFHGEEDSPSADGRATSTGIPKGWRDDLHNIIWRRAGELRLDSEQVCEVARQRLGKAVSSLDDLNARELGMLLSALLEMKRPALD